MNATVSALPSAMQTRLDAARAAQDPPAQDPPNAPATPTAPAAPAAADDTKRVTLSQEEYEDLKALAGRATTAQGRTEISDARIAELEARLTQLSEQNKSPPAASAAPAAPAKGGIQLPDAPITYTEKETEDFGESKEYVAKVAREVTLEVLKEVLPQFNAQLNELKTTASTLGNHVTQSETARFKANLSAAVPEYEKLFTHKHWEAFLDKVDAASGQTYEQLLRKHITDLNADSTAHIYKLFKSEYATAADNGGAFAGASPSGAQQLPAQEPTKTKLKLSDRKKASLDFQKKLITWDQLEEIKKAFDEAEKAGNVDYNA